MSQETSKSTKRQRGRTTLRVLIGIGAVLVAGLLITSPWRSDRASAADAPSEKAAATPPTPSASGDGPKIAPPPVAPARNITRAASWEAARDDSRDYNQRARLIARGYEVYNNYCVGCHGAYGDGKGEAAERLITKPRDFTAGIYKFRSTDSGSLPLETDMHRTITRGLSRVSMPAFPMMPEQEKLAVIEYIKTFYPKWDAEAANRKVVPIPRAPEDLSSPERTLRGRVVYLAMGCGNCHGSDGAGSGATAHEYKDAWGFMIRPFNFTRGRLKGGDDPEDVYRTFHTGLRSVMPAFGGTTLAYVAQDQVASQSKFFHEGEEQRLAPAVAQFPKDADAINAMSPADLEQRAMSNSWDLVSYILSLRRGAEPSTGSKPGPDAGSGKGTTPAAN